MHSRPSTATGLAWITAAKLTSLPSDWRRRDGAVGCAPIHNSASGRPDGSRPCNAASAPVEPQSYSRTGFAIFDGPGAPSGTPSSRRSTPHHGPDCSLRYRAEFHLPCQSQVVSARCRSPESLAIQERWSSIGSTAFMRDAASENDTGLPGKRFSKM